MGRYVDTSAIIQVIGNIYNNVSLLDYEEYHFCEDDFPESFHKILFYISIILANIQNNNHKLSLFVN